MLPASPSPFRPPLGFALALAIALGCTATPAQASLVPVVDAKDGAWVGHVAAEGVSLDVPVASGLWLGALAGRSTYGSNFYGALRASGRLVSRGEGGPMIGWSLLGGFGDVDARSSQYASGLVFSQYEATGGGSTWLALTGALPLWGERLVLRGAAGPMAFAGRRDITDPQVERTQVRSAIYIQPLAVAWELSSTFFPGWPELVLGGGQSVGLRARF